MVFRLKRGMPDLNLCLVKKGFHSLMFNSDIFSSVPMKSKCGSKYPDKPQVKKYVPFLSDKALKDAVVNRTYLSVNEELKLR